MDCDAHWKSGLVDWAQPGHNIPDRLSNSNYRIMSLTKFEIISLTKFEKL